MSLESVKNVGRAESRFNSTNRTRNFGKNVSNHCKVIGKCCWIAISGKTLR